MKKRYLFTLLIALVLISIVLYSIIQLPFISNKPQTEGNQTQGDKGFFGLPIFFPWQTKNETGTVGGGVTGGGGKVGGGSGGGGSTGESSSSQKNYISINSIPAGLKIFASYYTNGEGTYQAQNTPFDLEVDPNSPVCFLSASVTNGTLKWTVDEQYCQFSTCEMSSYNRTETLYSDHGCLVIMNENHSVTLQLIPY
jgi:hypothetical protein